MIHIRPVSRFPSSWVCSRCRAFATSSTELFQNTLYQRERHSFQKLPTSPARTRFAPSPTGYLHLGSLRTALFNLLLAKATGGQFLLRIEDTDQKRTVADAEERLYEDLHWAGLQWDEGPDRGGPYGPYKQSQRTALYQEHAKSLLDSQHAYRCFCSSERTNLPTQVLHGDCASTPRDISEERMSIHESHVIRLKMPKHGRGYTDLVYGTVGGERATQRTNKFLGQECFTDPVLIKSDGFPTYHLANVVDDHYMKITHVIRAAEWMPSTPMHVVMYEALGWEPPLYAHVGLLQNKEGQKYSKRTGDANLDMRSLAMRGTFPEALINYVALHGWSHNLGNDFLRMDDLIHNFDLKFTKGNTVIIPTKLVYFQRMYAKKYAEEGGPRFEDMVDRVVAAITIASQNADRSLICPTKDFQSRVTLLLQLEANKYTYPREFFSRITYFFFSQEREKDCQWSFHPIALGHLGKIHDCFSDISHDHWCISTLTKAMEGLNESLSGEFEANSPESDDIERKIRSQLQAFLRWAVSYGYPGPAMVRTMQILGRDVTIGRLEDAMAYFESLIQFDGAPSPT